MDTPTQFPRIRDLVKKPSQVIDAMIHGLQKAADDPEFRFDMLTFGDVREDICYGCAATCAVQELYGIRFTPEQYLKTAQTGQKGTYCHIAVLGDSDIPEFEYMIDSLRSGHLADLLRYCLIAPDLTNARWRALCSRWEAVYLNEDDWQAQVPLMQEICQELKDLDL